VHKKLLTRLVSGAVVVAVTAGSALLVSSVANAAPPAGTLGFNTITPAEGTDSTAMSSTTSGPCPTEAKAADLQITGPVGADPTVATFPPDNPFQVTTLNSISFSTEGSFTQQLNPVLLDAAQSRGKTIQVGEYDLTTRCLDRFGFTVLGTFTAGIVFDTPTHYTAIPNGSPSPTPTVTVVPSPTPTVTVVPSPTPTVTTVVPSPTPTVTVVPSPTPGPGAIVTTTHLSVLHIPLPFGLGGFVIPIAYVAPINAVGTVQFKDESTNLGRPVPVIGGSAFGGFFLLPARSHSLIAEFIPADPTTQQPSSSNTVTFTFRRGG
jgi:hypothetical protein